MSNQTARTSTGTCISKAAISSRLLMLIRARLSCILAMNMLHSSSNTMNCTSSAYRSAVHRFNVGDVRTLTVSTSALNNRRSSSEASESRPQRRVSFQDSRDDSDKDELPHRRAAARRRLEREEELRNSSEHKAQRNGNSKRDFDDSRQQAAKNPAKPASATASPVERTSPQTSTAAKQLAPPPTDEPVYPTFVPRNPGVTDGPWNNMDATMLQTAVEDAELAVTQKKIDAGGFVLLGKSLEELQDLVVSLGQPKYRAKQLLEGVLQGAHSIDDFKNIPKELKSVLIEAGVRTGRSILHKSVGSPDGTQKFLLQLSDGRVVETVGIPNDSEPTVGEGKATNGPRQGRASGPKRLTVCVSSQVGCPMRCSFCATGKGGFARNLMPHEILDQVLTVREAFGQRVSNVVFMGMGEPLLNIPSVVKTYHLINEQLGISGRSITVSTVGVPNAIPRLAKTEVKSTLAVSIHAPNQTIRESIIPSAKAYPIEALMKDCSKYFQITGRRVTFEYTLLSGVNDAPEHAQELAALLRSHNLMSHVNLIPWNPVDESDFNRPSRNRVFNFVRELEAAGMTATVRITRGLEAAAACGQLRNMHQKVPLPDFAVPA